jgi:hypothetical protein
VPPVPTVYVDEDETVVIDGGEGSDRFCLVGVEGRCLIATES